MGNKKEAIGKITLKYEGYFVSFWKKEQGKDVPYKIDEVDELLVRTVNGIIKLDKQYLIENKILSSTKAKGKLGFRIKKKDINYL